MAHHKFVAYALCLACGGAVAFLVKSKGATAVARDVHLAPEFVVPKDSAVHDDVAQLAEKLESGTVQLQDIVDVTSLLLATVKADSFGGADEIKLPLLEGKTPIGCLRMPPAAPDGGRQWIFEVTIQALPRHAGVADYTDVTLTYGGVGEAITWLSASSETSVHKRLSTVKALGSGSHVTGGWFSADATASRTCPITLTVRTAEDSQEVSWTSAVGELVQGDDHLEAAKIGSVAGILLSL